MFSLFCLKTTCFDDKIEHIRVVAQTTAQDASNVCLAIGIPFLKCLYHQRSMDDIKEGKE